MILDFTEFLAKIVPKEWLLRFKKLLSSSLANFFSAYLANVRLLIL